MSIQPSPAAERALILVVDDDPDIREALRDVLEQERYDVAEAGNGREALTYLASHAAPSAILLDLFMPVMDGWQLAERIQSTPEFAGIPLIVVTASGAHWGYPTGRVLLKPVDLSQLLEVVREVTPQHAMAAH